MKRSRTMPGRWPCAWGVVAIGMLAAAPAPAQTGSTPGPAPAKGLDCLIEPAQVVEVRAAVDGLIAAVHVQRGDPIRRGQTLVELQSAAEKAALQSARVRAGMHGPIALAKGRVQYASAKLARQKDLHSANFASAQSYEEAQAELRLAQAELLAAEESRQLAEADLARAQVALSQRSLVAPFNGVVLDRLLHPGDLAEAGSGRKAVLRVAQVDLLKADIVAPASLFGLVRTGAKVTIAARGIPGRHAATVAAVDKVIDAASDTFVVRVALPNPKHELPGGVHCTAQIEGVALPVAPARAATRLPPQ